MTGRHSAEDHPIARIELRSAAEVELVRTALRRAARDAGNENSLPAMDFFLRLVSELRGVQ